VATGTKPHNSCYMTRVTKWRGEGLTPKEIKPHSFFSAEKLGATVVFLMNRYQ